MSHRRAARWTIIPLLLATGTLAGREPTTETDATGRAGELVQRALRAELSRDNAAREQLLQSALQTEESYPPANWQLGRLETKDGYRSVADSIAAVQSDPDLQLYRKMRNAALGDPRAEERLARHCARLGLTEQAKLFYYRVLTNPGSDQKSRSGALRKLGLKPAYGTYMTRDQIREQEAAAKQQRAAFEKWVPRFRKWQSGATSGRRSSIKHAIEQVENINDPQFIPVADALAAHACVQLAGPLVELLRRQQEFEATQAIARYAVLSPSLHARRLAIEELKNRNLHDFVPLLMTALVAPVESRWRVDTDRAGNVFYQHQFFQDNQDAAVLADLKHVDVRTLGRDVRFDGPDDDRLVVSRRQEERNTPRERKAQIEAMAREREERVKRFNRRVAAQNERATNALEATTPQRNLSVGQWHNWWQVYNETYVPRPTRYLYRHTAAPYINLITDVYTRHSCFAAGTPVWTDQGLQAIETIQIGDRVLSQDVNTGELLWKLVIQTTAGASTSTHVAHLQVDGESIYPTLGHVVWVNGKGWKIAKRVEDGDMVHTRAGAAQVKRLADQQAPATVFNLVVPGTHTYFVGAAGILVHDITTRRPTVSILPGLASK